MGAAKVHEFNEATKGSYGSLPEKKPRRGLQHVQLREKK